MVLGDVIHFSQALPGTRYDFWLYYSNSSTESNAVTGGNLPQGNTVVPVGNAGGTVVNSVPSSVSTQSQWLLTWTASITTGMYSILDVYYFYIFNAHYLVYH